MFVEERGKRRSMYECERALRSTLDCTCRFRGVVSGARVHARSSETTANRSRVRTHVAYPLGPISASDIPRVEEEKKTSAVRQSRERWSRAVSRRASLIVFRTIKFANVYYANSSPARAPAPLDSCIGFNQLPVPSHVPAGHVGSLLHPIVKRYRLSIET